MLLPANEKEPNLCKAIAGSFVLGYSQPVIVNWNVSYDDPNLMHGGAHLRKLQGISDWLGGLPSERDDDLVIGTDAYDVWFQLRPEVVIARYYDTIGAANRRLRDQIGKKAMKKHHIDHSIVFAAQKRCGVGKWKWNEADCTVFPQSTLPEGVYGPETDKEQSGESPFQKFRQRFLNSGTWVGRVGPLRKLFLEAKRRAEADGNWGSDQRVLTEIFLNQEQWRNKLRSSTNRPHNRINRDGSEKAVPEYGLALDYESTIGIATVFAEDDLAWIHYNDTEQIIEESAKLQIVPARVEKMATDIAESRPPFLDSTDQLRKKTWSEVQLFTNMYTDIVPAMIHHNAHRDGRKALREEWWDRPWYFKNLRKLMEETTRAPVEPIISVREDDKEVVYMGNIKKGEWASGAFSDKGGYLSWHELCDEFDVEIFRD